MKMIKDSSHIRIRKDDKRLWKEYCNALGEPSPDLFSKILKSKELNLNQRILDEYLKKKEQFKKRLQNEINNR